MINITDITFNLTQEACLKGQQCMDWCKQQHFNNDYSFVILISLGFLALSVSEFIDEKYKKPLKTAAYFLMISGLVMFLFT